MGRAEDDFLVFQNECLLANKTRHEGQKVEWEGQYFEALAAYIRYLVLFGGGGALLLWFRRHGSVDVCVRLFVSVATTSLAGDKEKGKLKTHSEARLNFMTSTAFIAQCHDVRVPVVPKVPILPVQCSIHGIIVPRLVLSAGAIRFVVIPE